MDATTEKVLDWITGQHGVGASSKCMAAHLTGRVHDGSHPHDPADFKRCIGLLVAVPELRKQLSKMATVSNQWSGLVEKWAEIEELVLAEGDDAYRTARRFMRAILDPADDADPNVIRFGDDTSITFGR